eukprot:TRINITY_DN3053_c0_g1_i1.p1 TRINITY_DN3053_c0_g1~~TRINITY_DN3053_c0_g1_i1.p1  ORF type:complete len:362 (+),score=68.87 TRINITY_DN3053_c0_g1_i1:751-1836(+)
MGKKLVVQESASSTFPYWAFLTDKQEPGHGYFVFRGTNSAIDSVIDASAHLFTDPKGKLHFRAHWGSFSALNSKYKPIQKVIMDFRSQNPDTFKLTITGHSLGGAYAILLYMSLVRDSIAKPDETDCYTFGAPPVLAPPDDFAPPFSGKWHTSLHEMEDSIHNFVHAFDIVPRLLGNGVGPKVLSMLSVVDSLQISHYCAAAKDSEFIRNTELYQPFGNFYFIMQSAVASTPASPAETTTTTTTTSATITAEPATATATATAGTASAASTAGTAITASAADSAAAAGAGAGNEDDSGSDTGGAPPMIYKARGFSDKRTIMTLPVIWDTSFRPSRLLNDHYIAQYLATLDKCCAQSGVVHNS